MNAPDPAAVGRYVAQQRERVALVTAVLAPIVDAERRGDPDEAERLRGLIASNLAAAERVFDALGPEEELDARLGPVLADFLRSLTIDEAARLARAAKARRARGGLPRGEPGTIGARVQVDARLRRGWRRLDAALPFLAEAVARSPRDPDLERAVCGFGLKPRPGRPFIHGDHAR